MGTKNHPSAFDCHAAADPDEEMFILLGRDPMAGALVRAWADMREHADEDPTKVKEARDVADKLDAWATKKGKSLIVSRDLSRGDMLTMLSDAMEDVEDFTDDTLRIMLALAHKGRE
jgi:hypothetical protein